MLEHRFAILTAVATFVLLLIGGTVNATGSSLACPEPTLVCHGQLFPDMTGGVLYEHGHRLVAMTVGFLQIILTVLLWRRRRELRWIGVGALLAVCAQGALGAITVAFKLPTAVSEAHLAVAMLYFATLLFIVWRTRRRSAEARPRELGSIRTWVAVAGGFVLAQILLGGLVRHTGSTLACVDVPFCHGSIFPAGAPMAVKIHMLHRLGGVIVGLVVLASAIAIYRQARGWRTLRVLAVVAPLLVCVQIALGLYTITSFRAVPVAVAHFGGAISLWALWVTMWWMTREARLQSAADQPLGDLASEAVRA
jgi:heme A synthase